ncbi:MAG: bifunctional DNA primase/polymerase [Solirubrobacteraceae bacterium]
MSAPQEVLAAVARGWSVIPVSADKRPLVKWKRYQTERADAEQVEAWAAGKQPAAWAVVTGAVSGLVILDFDGDAGQQRLADYGMNPHVRTGSGGHHVYFEHPGRQVGTLNGQAAHDLGKRFPGLDIRGDGGYACFHGRNGSGPYCLQRVDPEPWEAVPEPVRAFLGLAAENEARDPAELVTDALRRVNGGEGRNNTGFKLACQLRDNGYNFADAERVLGEYATKVPASNAKGEPYTAQEARESVRSAYAKPARRRVLATSASSDEARAQLAKLFKLHTLAEPLTIIGATIIGDGGDAAAYVQLSDGSELRFRSLREMTQATKLFAEVVATTGAVPKLNQQLAGEAVALLKRFARHIATMNDDDEAIEWGVNFLQAADTIDVDIDDQGERWAAFCKLDDVDPRRKHAETRVSIAAASVVLRCADGSRLVRTDWFRAFVKSIEARMTPAQIATMMMRVGWVRRGAKGRWKASRPGLPGQRNMAFWLVPADWEDRGEEIPPVAVTPGAEYSPAPAPVGAHARVGGVTRGHRNGGEANTPCNVIEGFGGAIGWDGSA